MREVCTLYQLNRKYLWNVCTATCTKLHHIYKLDRTEISSVYKLR